MKAALLHHFSEDVVIEDIDLALPPQANEVLVRTVACGVCHSDRTMQLGSQPVPLPLLLGHEPSGVVEQVGSAVTYVKPGDHVTLCPSAFCGTCRWCMRGQLHLCENKGVSRADGTARLTYHGDPVLPFCGLGGFAEQMLVNERSVVKLPEGMPLDRAALLGCGVVTGLGAALHTARVQPGQTVAVIGCGGVGLNVIQGALLAGAARIIAVDRLAAKLEMAKTFGATDVVDASTADPVEAVKELTAGRGVEHAIEVVGIAPTIEQAFHMLDRQGTATVVGMARPEVEVKIKAAELLLERRLQGCIMGSTRFRLDIPLYTQLYLDGRLKLDELLSETLPLANLNTALKQLDSPLVARAVVTF